MQKYYSQTATVAYQPDATVVGVIFGSSGNGYDYAETIRIARGIAQVHRSTSYMVKKDTFTNMPVSEYGLILSRWMNRLDNQSVTRQSIALVVPSTVFSLLFDYFLHARAFNYRYVAFKVVTSREEGFKFLKATGS